MTSTKRCGRKPAHLVETQVRGENVATAKLTDRQVSFERARAQRVRDRNGELPLRWTTNRAEWLWVTRQAYEAAIYGEHYAHLPNALERPESRSGKRVWNGPQ